MMTAHINEATGMSEWMLSTGRQAMVYPATGNTVFVSFSGSGMIDIPLVDVSALVSAIQRAAAAIQRERGK